MNKLFSKIAALTLGLGLAVGVGVAVGHNSVQEAKAGYPSITFVTSAENLGYTSTTKNNASMESDGVTITFSSITGKTTDPARVQLPKNGTITSTEIDGFIRNVTINDYAHTGSNADGSFTIKGSADGTTFYDVKEYEDVAKDAGTISTDFKVSDKYTYFKVVNGSSRVLQLSSLVVTYEEKVTKTVKDVTGVNEAPSSVFVGDTIDFSDVKLDVLFDDDTTGTVTATSVSCDTSKAGNVTATATYENATGTKTATFTVEVKAVVVEKIEALDENDFKTSFKENEKFSFGDEARIKVTYNNEKTANIKPTDEGVTAKIGDLDITGNDYFVKLDDKDKTVTITYQTKSFEYAIASVTSEIPTDGHYEKVTEESGLALNGNYIIVNESSKVALSTTQNTNNRGETSVTISSSSIASVSDKVEVFTLVEGTVTKVENVTTTTYGLKTHDDKYIYAAGGSGNNYLKTNDTLIDNGSFTITFSSGNAVITARGQATRNLLRYNSTSNCFSCYSSGQSPVQLYKFVANEKSADQLAVEKFVEDYMHFDTVDYNNHADTGACKGESGYYAAAKAAYLELTAEQKALFASSSDFVISRARDRLVAWALANGEIFNPAEKTFTTASPIGATVQAQPGYVLVIVMVTLGVTALGLIFLLRKKKND